MFICHCWDEGSFVPVDVKMTLDLWLVAFAGRADRTREGYPRKRNCYNSHFMGEE